MTTRGGGFLCLSLAAGVLLSILGASDGLRRADNHDFIGGVVASDAGPEAGVWVIAETTDLPTRFAKIVVTDDQGRFMLPDLPDAAYHVWVRGYGLVDSPSLYLRPGVEDVRLTAVTASTPAEAAQVYPAEYWLSLLEPPGPDEFPGAGGDGEISAGMQTQAQWVNNLKSGCHLCHQMGNEITRSLTHLESLGFESSIDAWDHRVQVGVRGNQMNARFNSFGRDHALGVFADWTDRIAAGEVPEAPPRPVGVERNVVITMWDWGVETSYMHDLITTDKNDPTVNAGGPVYAVSGGHGTLVILDPESHETHEITIPTREDPAEVATRFPPPNRPSVFYGDSPLWGAEHPADPHNPMMDRKGRVWMTSTIRNAPNPAWCREADLNEFARYFPLTGSNRQASFYDPRTEEFTLIDTCFSTHHLQFAADQDQTLFFNEATGPIIGWINTRSFDLTGDEQGSQGWCGQVLDTNGDGRITRPWNVPGEPFDPTRDTLVNFPLYSVIPDPTDPAVVWAASERFPGYIVRLNRGENPPETCITELYEVPDPGFDPRGIDIDLDGLVWTALAGSSHWASFDRRECRILNGPETLRGDHCPEGWTLYRTPGPTLRNTDIPADFQYYNWVDQYNVSGLGQNVPWAAGSNSDALVAYLPNEDEWVYLRVPYPLGFYQRLLDGRIDQASEGWKGRALWANYGTHLLWHVEGGRGTKSKAVKFQIRPDPLAR